LLVGEGVDPNELRKLRALLQSEAGVEEVRRIVTMHFGPQTVLLATELRFRPDRSVQEIASIAATLKKKIREGRPEIKHIFIALDSDKKCAPLKGEDPLRGKRCRGSWGRITAEG
jgi:divalent metal cation (Fe/Co/Zn/Cd) transporter